MVVLTRRIKVAAAMFAAGFPSAVAAQGPEDEPRVRLDVPAPSFALNDVAGHRWRLWQLRGADPAVLWFSEAVGDAEAWSDLVRVNAKYRARGVRFVAIVVGGETPTQSWRKVDLPGALVLRDPKRELAGWYRIQASPRVVLLDRALVVRWLGQGRAAATIDRAIDALLSGAPMPPPADPPT